MDHGSDRGNVQTNSVPELVTVPLAITVPPLAVSTIALESIDTIDPQPIFAFKMTPSITAPFRS